MADAKAKPKSRKDELLDEFTKLNEQEEMLREQAKQVSTKLNQIHGRKLQIQGALEEHRLLQETKLDKKK